MKYDDASWHYGGDFPQDLPQKAGATHIAMFAVWCWLHGLAGDEIAESVPDMLAQAEGRSASPTSLFVQNCDGKLVDEDLNDEGAAFALAYYANEKGLLSTPMSYIADYSAVFDHVEPSLYHVPDTWETYDQISRVIAHRFQHWRSQKAS